MNADTARNHLSREPDQMPDVTDVPSPLIRQPAEGPPALTDPLPGDVFPVSASMPAGQWSQPNEEVTHEMRVLARRDGQIRIICTCRENGLPWSRTIDSGHTIEDLVRFAEMHGGPGQPGENKGEPDGLVGPGPATDFSSPSSPPAEGMTLVLSCEAVAGEMQCGLPSGHYAGHNALWRGHSISWPADEPPFGSESEPQS